MADFVFDVCKATGPGGGTGVTDMYAGFWSGWQGIVLLALFSSAMLLALLLFAARFFRNQQLEVWVRAEVGQLFVTGAIAGLAIFSVAFLCDLKPAMLEPVVGADKAFEYGEKNFYQVADSYLIFLRQINEASYLLLTFLFWVVNANLGVTYHANPVGVGFTSQVLAGLAPFTQVIIIVTQALTVSFMLVLIQIKVLQYLTIATVGYLFPLGVLLRAFEPTRMFGGALIALSLGMFIMYPALLVMNDFVINNPDMNDWRIENYGNRGLNAQAETREVLNQSQGREDAARFEAERIREFQTNDKLHGVLWNWFFPVISGAMYVFVASVFFPAVNFAVLIGFIKELSHLLGEEMDISSITRMI